MNLWPEDMTVKPIVEWPGKLKTTRITSQFRSSTSRRPIPVRQTLAALQRELDQLRAKDVILQVAITADQFRIDGRPRAGAAAVHPGVILTMNTPHGALSYPCDTFLTWEDNLRAIALALEALRKVDRYGVSGRGEQYRGFLAIEAAHAAGPAAPRPFDTATAAADFLLSLLEHRKVESSGLTDAQLVRRALRLTHPDSNDGVEDPDFGRVKLADLKLREAGRL